MWLDPKLQQKFERRIPGEAVTHILAQDVIAAQVNRQGLLRIFLIKSGSAGCGAGVLAGSWGGGAKSRAGRCGDR